MNTWDYINRIIFDEQLEVSDEIIDYYRKHPKDLDLITDKASFNFTFFILIFLAGILITFTSKLVQYYWAEHLNGFVKSVLLDIFSEIGIAVFGGAVVAYFIEFHRKKQYQRNVKVRNKIKAILDKEK